MSEHQEEHRCPQCGYPLLQRRETYDYFDVDDMDLMDCPRCGQMKQFGRFNWDFT
jgi:ribosomal protein S27AE